MNIGFSEKNEMLGKRNEASWRFTASHFCGERAYASGEVGLRVIRLWQFPSECTGHCTGAIAESSDRSIIS